MNRDDFKSLLERHGLGDVSDAILAVARKCVRFTATEDPPTGTAVGVSKIGGPPDLPADADWPQRNGRSLTFLAQIALSHIPYINDPVEFPRSGLLAFFYDTIEQPWGFDPDDAGSSRVLYFPEPTWLERRSMPLELSDREQFAEVYLHPEEYYSLPDWEKDEVHSLNLNEDQMNSYDQVRSALGPEYPATCHQLLGWANEIQGPMELECQLVTNGLYCGDPAGYRDPRADALAHGVNDWRLLLQLDSDDNARMMWGDAGRLYIWIRQQDLVDCSFDATWPVLQCY